MTLLCWKDLHFPHVYLLYKSIWGMHIRAPLERVLCTLIVPSLALSTILYLYILRRTISKNHRSVRIFVPVNRVRQGPLKGFVVRIILIFYLPRYRIEEISGCNLNVNLILIPGNMPGIRCIYNII